jgi:hypothetical protein
MVSVTRGVTDMVELFPPLGLNKYDTWRILLVKCYIAILCTCEAA